MLQHIGATSATTSPTATLARPAETIALRQADVATLMGRAAAESDRFYRGQAYDTSFAYELFRRALVEHNQAAWDHLFVHYSPLVESWVRRCGAFASSGESSEFFVTSAFTRFWKAVTPERFASFATLAALLHYLQLCTGCVVIDSVRAQSWAEMLPEEALPPSRAPQTSPDEEAMARISRDEFWAYINTQLSDEAERAVVFDSFVLGLKPGDIREKHQHLFGCVNDVYNVKRNVLGRLGRNQELRHMLAS